MSGSSRAATRIEAKYNVTTHYPDLGLHSAAISGNVGLAHYALTHGQPENSVLHGLLPLHAASSGGSEQIVSMLIERGADVNAPRLPRRYSNDGQDRNVPTGGVSGSCPLHFAAANGHLSICRMLLAKGASVDRRDKHGLTPEDLAMANGHLEVVATLRAFQTLKLSLQERLTEDGDEHAVEDEELRGLPPLRSTSRLVGTTAKGGGMLRNLNNFAHRGRRSSSSAAQRPSSAGSLATVHRSSSLSSRPSQGRTGGELSSLRTLSKLSLTSDRSDSALSLSSPIETPSASRRLATDAPPVPLPAHLLPQSRNRRPSLPSIIERAAQQFAHPRSHHDSNDVISSRTRSFASSTDTHSIDSRSIASSSRFTSNQSLLRLFSRNRRPADHAAYSSDSASPSPPRSTSALQIDDEEIDRTIDSFRRSSFDFNPSSSRSSFDGPARRPPPPSAPSNRTDFFPPSPAHSSFIDPHRVPMQRSVSQQSEPSSDIAEYSGRPGGSLWSIGARGAGGERSPRIPDWSATSNAQGSRRRVSEGREETWSLGSKEKGRAGSSAEDPRYLSSYAVDNDPEYSPVSPNGSSPRQQNQQPWTPSTNSSPYGTEGDEPSAATSTNRPKSRQSSTISSLFRVASAKISRPSEGPSSPTSSYGELGHSMPSQLFNTSDDQSSTGGWNLRGIDPGPRRGFAGSTGRQVGRSRGASMNSNLSSTFSVSPQLASHLSEEEEDEQHPNSSEIVPPAIFVSSTSPPAGRSRALSGSSLVSNQSHRRPVSGGSGGTGSGSSYTSLSFLSSGAPSASSGPAVSSVPEDGSTPLSRSLSTSSPSRRNSPHRVSSYAEAKNLVRQAEKDLLDLPATRSASGGSTVSLAAQLAAYGERLAIEREFARGDSSPESSRQESSAPSASLGAQASPRKASNGGSSTLDTVEDRSPKDAKQQSASAGDSPSDSPTRARGKMASLLGFKNHPQAQTKEPSHNEPIASSPPILPPIDLGPVPQAPPSGAHYLATTLPDVAKVYQDRAEALRKRGQQVASALGSPLTSPVSPSLRRGSHPPPSVEAAQGKIWVISGQPPVAVKTPPTPEHGSVASSSKLPAVPSARKNARLPKAYIAPAGRKHSLDAQTLSTSNGIKRSSPLSPPINSSANPLRSTTLGSARGSPSGVTSSAKSRGSLDTTPQPSREHSPAPSPDGSQSRYEVLKSSNETAYSSSSPATLKSGQTVGLGLGQIGGSSSAAISTASSTTRDDIGLEAYGTKRKNSAPGWGSRLLQSMGRKS